MSDELESTQEPQETEATPKPKFSEPSEDQQTSTSGKDESVASFMKQLRQDFDDFKREMQSQKDRRWSQLEKSVGNMSEFMEQLGELKTLTSQGMSEEEALRTMRLSRVEQEVFSKPQQTPGTSEADDFDASVDRILDKAGLNSEARKAVQEEWAKGEYSGPDKYKQALEDLTSLTIKAATRPVEVNPSQAPAVSGAASGGGGDVESLTNELSQLLASPSNPNNRKRIEEISAELDRLQPMEHIEGSPKPRPMGYDV